MERRNGVLESTVETEDTDERAPRKFPLRLLTLALITAVFVALTVMVAIPFLHAITWGIALSIIAWPMHKAIRTRIASPSVAATVSTLIVVLIIVIPGLFVINQVSREATEFVDSAESGFGTMEFYAKLDEIPALVRAVEWLRKVNVDVATEVGSAVQGIMPNLQGVMQGSIAVLFQFLVAMFILFFAFRDRGEFVHGLRQLMPLTKAEGDRILTSAAGSVHANIYATVVTGAINATTGATLFWFLDVRAPFLWGIVMFVLAVLPIVGAGIVWVPVAVYFILVGNWPSALAIFTWGLITGIFIDYMLYARLAGAGMRMHAVPALIAFLGGLALFGISGMILGPAIVAMTSALLDLWRHGGTGAESVMNDAA